MKFQDLLSDLGAHMGLGHLQPDESGTCRLVFNGQVGVDLETDHEAGQTLVMHTVVGRMPTEGRRAFSLLLLGGNHLAQMTQGAVLGIDATTDEVVLHRRLPLEACGSELVADELATLVSTAMKWSAHLETRGRQEPAASGTHSEADMLSAGMIRV